MDRRCGRIHALAACLTDSRDPSRITHELRTMLVQPVCGFALGASAARRDWHYRVSAGKRVDGRRSHQDFTASVTPRYAGAMKAQGSNAECPVRPRRSRRSVRHSSHTAGVFACEYSELIAALVLLTLALTGLTRSA